MGVVDGAASISRAGLEKNIEQSLLKWEVEEERDGRLPRPASSYKRPLRAM